jgi:hypothetical protein
MCQTTEVAMEDPVATWREELSLLEKLMRSRPGKDWTQERERIAELERMIANAGRRRSTDLDTVELSTDDGAAGEIEDKGESPGGANFA